MNEKFLSEEWGPWIGEGTKADPYTRECADGSVLVVWHQGDRGEYVFTTKGCNQACTVGTEDEVMFLACRAGAFNGGWLPFPPEQIPVRSVVIHHVNSEDVEVLFELNGITTDRWLYTSSQSNHVGNAVMDFMNWGVTPDGGKMKANEVQL